MSEITLHVISAWCGDDHYHNILPTAVVGQSVNGNAEGEQKFATVIQGYIKEIEELK